MKLFSLVLLCFGLLISTETFAAPRTITLDVQNMTCAVCPITVKKALESVTGVTSANVDFDNKTATVEFDDSTSVQALTDSTKAAGYPSTVREDVP
jgi:mercuric ion binding protein